MIKKCKNCGKEDEHHSQGLCYKCYRKLIWRPPKIICRRCGREMPHHSKGFCPGCYNFVFRLDKAKEWNHKKKHNIPPELYKKITQKCLLCGFDNIVDLHHLDENNKNNEENNLIGLCHNHHKMLHDFRFRKEIKELLKGKGINLSEDKKLEFTLR